MLLYVGTDELKEEMKTVQTDAVIAVYDEEGGLICSGAGWEYCRYCGWRFK